MKKLTMITNMTDRIPDYAHTFLIAYQEEENKKLLRDIKLLDPNSLARGAELIYTYICMDTGIDEGPLGGTRNLLLHAPSSAYAKSERNSDQVLDMLKRIGKISARGIEHGLHIDIMPHFFILNYDKRDAQHEANRALRIENARHKFRIFLNVPESCLDRYDRIYIIDDVSTTGHTLQALASLLADTYPRLAGRVRTLAIAH